MREENVTLPFNANTAGQPFTAWSLGLPESQRPAFGPERILAGFDHGWVLLTDGIIGTSPPTPIDLVLLHPQIGVALLEVAPHWTRHAPTRLRHRLDQARFGAIFPGHLPVVHRMLRPAELAALPRLLADAFADQPPLSLPGGDAWTRAVHRALLARPVATPDIPLPSMPRRGAARRGRLATGLAAAAAIGILAVVILPGILPDQPEEATVGAQPTPPAITAQTLDPAAPDLAAWPTSTTATTLGEVRSIAFAAGEKPMTESAQAAEATEIGSGQDLVTPAVPMPGTPPTDPVAPGAISAAPTETLELAPAIPGLALNQAAPALVPPPPADFAAKPTEAPQPAPAPGPALAAPAIIPPPPPPAARPTPNPAVLIALLRRGEALLAIGDVSGARRFFERVADAGSAAGALAAGRTYDPEVLAALGAWGIRPDPVAASTWYHRARELEQQAPTETETAR